MPDRVMSNDDVANWEFKRAMEDKIRRRREDKEPGYIEKKALAMPNKEHVEDEEDEKPDRVKEKMPGLLEAMRNLTYHMSRKVEKGQEKDHDKGGN